jgi:hypothetical protein
MRALSDTEILLLIKNDKRKESLRLTLLKYKFLKLISTLEIILLMRWTVSKTLERKLEVLN